jgi:drug/metabolite transporter (DMT)-like permease
LPVRKSVVDARHLPIACTCMTTATTSERHSVRAVAERHPVGVVAFGVVLFSTGPVMVGAASVSGPVFSFWRLWIGSAVLLLVALLDIRRTRRWPSRTGVKWVALGGIAFGLHQLSFMSALRMTSVVDVTLMNTIAPIVVAILAVPLFGERPGPAFRLWSAVAMAGAAFVVVAGSTGAQGDPAGMALAATNVVFYALFFVWSKLGRDHIDPISFVFGATLGAALTVSGFILVSGSDVGDITSGDLLLCLGVALVPGFIGHFSVTWSLRWVPANVPPVLMLAIPALSGVMAWLLIGQRITPLQVVAGAVTLAGVAGAVRTAPTTPPIAEALAEAEKT